MTSLPTRVAAMRAPFAPLFSRRVWAHAQVLLAPARRGDGRVLP